MNMTGNKNSPERGMKEMLRYPSQRALFIGLVLIIICILSISFTLASLDSYRQQARLAQRDVLTKAKLLGMTHEQWLSEMESMLNAMAAAVEREQGTKAGCRHLLPEYANVSPGIDVVMLLDMQGELICSTQPQIKERNFADREYFKRVLSSKRFVVGHNVINRLSKQRVIPMAIPIHDRRGELKQVLVAGRTLDWLDYVLARQGHGLDMAISIISASGVVQVHGSDTNVETDKAYPSNLLLQMIKHTSEGTVNDVLPDGKEYLIAYSRLGETQGGMYLVATQLSDTVLSPTLNIIRDNLLQFVMTMVIIVSALWIGLGKWILRPLKNLAQTMSMVRDGGADVRVKGMGPTYELYSISENFNDMLATLSETEKRLKQLAEHDALLGIPNRRLLDESMHNEWRRMSREKKPLSLLMIDVDMFKKYNDFYGHQAGDDCLKQVSDVLRQVVSRPADIVARYGGEEFVVLLPGNDGRGALRIAESIQEAMGKACIPHATSDVAHYVTLSIGVSSMKPSATGNLDNLLAQADQALYRAKHNGRNRIEVAADMGIVKVVK